MKTRQASTNFTGAEGAGAGRCSQAGLQCVHGGHFKQGAVRRGGGVRRVSAPTPLMLVVAVAVCVCGEVAECDGCQHSLANSNLVGAD